MPRKPGKHTPYFELVDAQSQAGCPICRLVYKATDRYLDSLLYEAVLDPDVRAKLKQARGFCAEHVEMLARVPGRALGVALIYRDIIRLAADTAEAGRFEGDTSWRGRLLGKARGGATTAKRLLARQDCPACVIGRQAEHAHLELLLAHLHEDQLYKAYAEGEGLCLRHLVRALEAVEDAETFQRLIIPQVTRYRLMLRDLDEFIRKHDHRFSAEKFGEEGDVWLRAMNTIVGGAGLGLSAKAGGRRAQDIIARRR